MTGTVDVIRDFLTANAYQLEDSGELDSSRDLLADGVLDSLGLIDLVAFLEQRFSITFDPSEMVADRFKTLRTIADFVDEKLAARG